MGAVKRLLDQSSAAMDLYSAELHECHRLLDTVGISQSGFDEQLSISQRVAQAVEIIKGFRRIEAIVGA